METIGNIFHLSGYGIYVWPAFGVTLFVLLWMGVSTMRRLRINEAVLARLQEIRDEIEKNEGSPET